MARVRTVPAPPPRPQGPVVRRHFGPADRIVMEGVDYRCIETNEDGHVFQAAHDETIKIAVRHEEMPEKEDHPDYRHDREWYGLGHVKARMHAGVALLANLPSKERDRILFKFEWAQEFLKLEESDETVTRGDPSVKAAILRIEDIVRKRLREVSNAGRRRRAGRKSDNPDAPGPKALLIWANKLVEHDHDPLCFRDDYRKSGNRKPKLQEDAYDLIWEVCDGYLVPRKPSIREVYGRIARELPGRNEKRVAEGKSPLKMPSYDCCREAIERLSEFDKMACREGIAKAMRKFRPVGPGLIDVDRPFQQAEMDHWTVQAHVLCKKAGVWDSLTDEQKKEVERVRYKLGMVIDRRTRCIAALRLTRTATEESALELLEMAVTDKREYATSVGAVTPWDIHGTMHFMYADGAFGTRRFKAALGDLKINFEIPPAGLPHMRGIIERAFRMEHQDVVARFDGRTFENIIAKGDYDSEARAGACIDELAKAVVLHAVDVHHNTPHPALDYETPRECWLRLTKEVGVDSSPDWHKRRHVFGIDIPRTLGPAGIRFLNVQYRSKKLHEYFRREGSVALEVRVHESNMGAISVMIDGGWLRVKGPPEYHRLPIQTWIAAEADLRRRGYVTATATASVRHKAYAEMDRLAKLGQQRASIDDERTTAAQLLAAERQMTIGVSFPEDQPATDGGDLYDGAMQVGASETERSADHDSGGSEAAAADVSGERDRKPKTRSNSKSTTPPAKATRPRRERTWTIKE